MTLNTGKLKNITLQSKNGQPMSWMQWDVLVIDYDRYVSCLALNRKQMDEENTFVI